MTLLQIKKDDNAQEISYQVEGAHDPSKALVLEPLKLVLQYDRVDMIEAEIGQIGGGNLPPYQVSMKVLIDEVSTIEKHAKLRLDDADERAFDQIPLTAYNCPYAYIFRNVAAKKACMSVIVPLQGYQYQPSLEESSVDKATASLTKIITLTKNPISASLYEGIAISPVATYKYENRISSSDFFEVHVKLLDSNIISYAKSKPRTMNPDELS